MATKPNSDKSDIAQSPLSRHEKACIGVLLLWLLSALAFFCGCAYKGGKVVDGTNLEIGLAIPGTEWSINAISYTAGLKVAANTNTTITVTNEVSETNSYFYGLIYTQRHSKMRSDIIPCPKTTLNTK
jgi:hypothetical protein